MHTKRVLFFSVAGIVVLYVLFAFLLQYLGNIYLSLAALPHNNVLNNLIAGIFALLTLFAVFGWIYSALTWYRHESSAEKRTNFYAFLIVLTFLCAPFLFKFLSFVLILIKAPDVAEFVYNLRQISYVLVIVFIIVSCEAVRFKKSLHSY